MDRSISQITSSTEEILFSQKFYLAINHMMLYTKSTNSSKKQEPETARGESYHYGKYWQATIEI